MTPRLASAAGVALLALLAGCEPASGTAAVAAPASAPVVDTVLAADISPHARRAVVYGGGIRPTGATANGIAP